MNIGKGMVAYQGHSFSDGYEAGYEARDKEAEEEKRELIDALVSCYYGDFRGSWALKEIIEKATGKSIEELLK